MLNIRLCSVMAFLLLRAAGWTAAQPLASTNLHNAFLVTSNIYSGSSPEGEAGFAELARLGVKTIVSVDGAKPDVETARRHGLRYIHLPFGYDGIPTNRVAELAKVADLAEGPFYVHCHHGKHRGPAAVAVMCEAKAGWGTNQAVRWLGQAGTAADYPGLYLAAREFKRPGDAELAAIQRLPEVARTSSLIEAMVALDEHLERLKGAQKTGWKSVPGHPDIQPAHEATLLWELYRELVRFSEREERTEDFRNRLVEAERSAGLFRQRVGGPEMDPSRADQAFRQVGQSCANCHKVHRN